MRRTTRRREKRQPDESGGFKFAVTLLAALGTVLYAVYNYLQNTPVDPFWYRLVCGLIAVALILVFYLLMYLLLKGYSMEVQDDSKEKDRLRGWASNIYLIAFFVFTVLLTSTVHAFVLKYLNLKLGFTYMASLIIGIFFILILYLYLFGVWSKFVKIRSAFFVGILMSVFLLSLLFPLVSHSSPLQGHIAVDMESIYYKNDAPIPVLIHTTGPNTNLSINLSKEESGHNLREIDNITLNPECTSNKTMYGKNSTLVGNALDYGTYNVFIKTSDLSVGYYELMCKRQKYKKAYGARGFYLLNSSEQSRIGEVTAS